MLKQEIVRALKQRYPHHQEIPAEIVQQIIKNRFYTVKQGHLVSFRNLPFSITNRLRKKRSLSEVAQGLGPELFRAYATLTIEQMYFLILARLVPPLLEYRDAYFEDRVTIPFRVNHPEDQTVRLSIQGVDRFYGLFTPLLEFVVQRRDSYEMKFPVFLRPRRVPWDLLAKWLWKLLSSYQVDIDMFWQVYQESTRRKHGAEILQNLEKQSQEISASPRAIVNQLTSQLQRIRPQSDLEEVWGIVLETTDSQRQAFRDYDQYVVSSLPLKKRPSRIQQLSIRRFLKSET